LVPKDGRQHSSRRHKIPLPAELKKLGCDNDLWSKIRDKDAFVRLLEAGDKAGVKERLDKLRNAPSVTGERMEMPAVLTEWGCDQQLWDSARAKSRLYNAASSGDEAEAKRLIEMIKLAVAKEAERSPLPPKDGRQKSLRKHEIPLPAELKKMGCDNDLWSKIRDKDAFVRLLEAGDEAGVKQRLDKLRNAPSVTGERLEMPAVLTEWGCDQQLWDSARAKSRLYNAASSGDEAEAKRLIEMIKLAVAKEAARPTLPPRAPAAPKAPKDPEKAASGRGKARPLTAGYTLDGEPPAGVDLPAVEKLLADRVAAKLAKDYETADRLQAELQAIGVFTNDRSRTWYGRQKRLRKHKIPLPAELKKMGCDNDLWSKIRDKDAFVRLLEAGDEAGVKERLDKLRNAPSVTGERLEMPAVLTEWGCDQQLWDSARAKSRLYNAASSGDEAEAKRLIEMIKLAVAKEAVRPTLPPRATAAPKAPKAPKKAASGGGKARPLTAGYTLDGEPPAGVDLPAVEKLLADRVAAKLAKDYETADRLQAELQAIGVFTNDRLRTWSGTRSAKQVDREDHKEEQGDEEKAEDEEEASNHLGADIEEEGSEEGEEEENEVDHEEATEEDEETGEEDVSTVTATVITTTTTKKPKRRTRTSTRTREGKSRPTSPKGLDFEDDEEEASNHLGADIEEERSEEGEEEENEVDHEEAAEEDEEMGEEDVSTTTPTIITTTTTTKKPKRRTRKRTRTKEGKSRPTPPKGLDFEDDEDWLRYGSSKDDEAGKPWWQPPKWLVM